MCSLFFISTPGASREEEGWYLPPSPGSTGGAPLVGVEATMAGGGCARVSVASRGIASLG